MGRAYRIVDTLIFIMCLPFYAVMIPVMWVDQRFFAPRCPNCGERTLEELEFVRAICADEAGRRYSDAYTYYLCRSCDARWRIHTGGNVEIPTDEEWDATITARFVVDEDGRPTSERRQPQWRAGNLGENHVYYEELSEGSWRRLRVESEHFFGADKNVIVVHLGTRADWAAQPGWAHGRRDEVLARMLLELGISNYQYEGEDVPSAEDSSQLVESAGGLL